MTFCTPTFKQQNSVVEEVAAECGDFLTVAFVDIVALPAIAERFGVQGLPVSVLLRHGRVVRRLSGSQPKEAYLRAVHLQLASDPRWHLAAVAASGEALARP